MAAAAPSLELDALGTGVAVALPIKMFSSIKEEVALTVTALDMESIEGFAKELTVAGAAVIDLWTLESRRLLEVKSLDEPIAFSLPANFTTGMLCAYWDEEKFKWSTDGVWAGNNVPGEPIKCLTTHLSLFGAIIRGIIETVECSTVMDLLTAHAVKETLRGHWLTTMGAKVFAAHIALLLLLFIIGARLDYKRHEHGHWKDSFLLVQEVVPDLHLHSSSIERDHSGYCMPLATTFCVCCIGLKDNQILRDAIDDIGSSWFEYFGEVRTALEECVGCMQANTMAVGFGLSMHHVRKATHAMAFNFILMSSRRKAAATLGVSDDLLSFVVEDEDIGNYLADQRLPGIGDWRNASSQGEAWAALRREVCETICANTRRQGSVRPGFFATVASLFLLKNPIAELFVRDVFISCKLRVLLFACSMVATFTMCCVFFEASGLAKGKARAGCNTDNEDGLVLGETIGRFFVVSFACLLIADLPVYVMSALLAKDFKKIAAGPQALSKQLRIWKVQERLVWLVGLTFLILCGLYTSLFLASVGDQDHKDWSTTMGLALLQDVIIFPFGLALMVPLMAKVFLSTHVRLSGETKENYMRKVTLEFFEKSNAMLPIEVL